MLSLLLLFLLHRRECRFYRLIQTLDRLPHDFLIDIASGHVSGNWSKILHQLRFFV